MTLQDLGFTDMLGEYMAAHGLSGFAAGRVIAEHRERYVVRTATGDYESEVTGNLRFTARNREDFPAVGDWVALTVFEPDMAIIHQVLPRGSIIKRQAGGQKRATSPGMGRKRSGRPSKKAGPIACSARRGSGNPPS